jgi:hypothetical protein
MLNFIGRQVFEYRLLECNDSKDLCGYYLLWDMHTTAGGNI